MKLIKGILGCVLAAGLMDFATDKAQAAIVIGNDLYTPFQLKLVITYQTSDGKYKKMSVNSKTVLSKLGYKGATLAYYEGNGDVYVIITKTKEIVDDLTADGIMTADFLEKLSYEKDGKGGAYKYSEVGNLHLQINSDGDLEESVVSKAAAYNGFYSFDMWGIYSLKYSESKLDKNDNYNAKVTASAPQMTGTGVDTDLSEDTLPVAGGAKFKGSGKLSEVP